MIKEVYYNHIPESELDSFNMNEYPFYQNMIDIGTYFHSDYEQYELNQRKVIDSIIKEAIDNDEIEKPDMDSVMLMMSTKHAVPSIVIALEK